MNRGRQLIRQWKLLRLLEASRAGVSIEALHQQVEEPCVPRTIQRDLAALEAAGFPLVCVDGRWRLLRLGEGAWTVPIEPTQVVALMLAETAFDASPLSAPLIALRKRLESMLSPRSRQFCEELGQSLRATTFAPVVLDAEARYLDNLQQGIREHRLLRMDYWSPESGDSTRDIEPQLLWHAGGGLYVVAWDHRSEEIRTFAVQRIRGLKLLDERFKPEPSFDPAAFTRAGFGVFHGKAYRVVVEFRSEIEHLVRERLWHASQRLEEIEEGVRATWTMAGLPEIARWVAGFGGQARAIAPRELVRRVREIHVGGLASSSMARTE